MGRLHALNEWFAASRAGRYFNVEGRKTTLVTEVRAGFVTFLTAAYILAVNSAILTDTGGTCTDADCTGPTAGEPGCRFNSDPGFIACQQTVRQSLIIATASTSLIACFLMGAVANMPLAVAPGMGINAYFTYTIVGYLGTGVLTYQQALAAVFVEGFIFIALSVSGVRGRFISLVPKCIMLATAGGIGLFLAFIGLQNSEGLSVLAYDSATLVTLGGCPAADRVPQYTISNTSYAAICQGPPDPVTGLPSASGALGAPSSQYFCAGNKMRSATMWLGICGGVIMVLLMAKKVKGAIMVGIIFTTAISWIPNTKVSYLGENSDIPGGNDRWYYFKQVVAVPNASVTAVKMQWDAFGTSQLWIALISMLYLDFLDATGTLFSMSSMLNRRIPGFINEETKAFPRQMLAFCVDGVAIVIGSLLGCAPLTVYIESASGIREGGRTGIVALTVAFGFFVSLFFAPLIASIPPYATGPALILVGAMMMENLVDIDWGDVRQSAPAFVAIITMPLTYSIAYGVIAGLATYICIYLCLLVIDLTLAMFSKTTSVRDVLIAATPDVFAGRIKRIDPLKSPSAVLQEHQNPEHIKHHAAVANNMYVEKGIAADKNVDKLPVSSTDGSSGSGDMDAHPKDQA